MIRHERDPRRHVGEGLSFPRPWRGCTGKQYVLYVYDVLAIHRPQFVDPFLVPLAPAIGAETTVTATTLVAHEAPATTIPAHLPTADRATMIVGLALARTHAIMSEVIH